MGKFLKGLVKVSVATAAVGGLCYAFKDKIKETDVYKNNNMDEKIQKAKTTIKEKVATVFDNEKDFVEDEDLFDEDFDLECEDTNRDYVSITPENPADDTSSDDTVEEDAAEDDATEEDTEA